MFNKQVQRDRTELMVSSGPSSTSPHQTQKHFGNEIELQVSAQHRDYKACAKILLYANELVNCSSWGFPLMGRGKAAEPDVWLCPCWGVALCRPPPAQSTSTQLHWDRLTSGPCLLASIYHNSCLLLPWLLVFLLPFILQCTARVILLGLI